MKQINSDRSFRLWEYRVSHDQLLVRSPKSETNSTNFDLIFVGVKYIELPALFSGLSIVSGTAADTASFAEKTGRAIVEERVFAVTTNGRRYTQ